MRILFLLCILKPYNFLAKINMFLVESPALLDFYSEKYFDCGKNVIF